MEAPPDFQLDSGHTLFQLGSDTLGSVPSLGGVEVIWAEPDSIYLFHFFSDMGPGEVFSFQTLSTRALSDVRGWTKPIEVDSARALYERLRRNPLEHPNIVIRRNNQDWPYNPWSLSPPSDPLDSLYASYMLTGYFGVERTYLLVENRDRSFKRPLLQLAQGEGAVISADSRYAVTGTPGLQCLNLITFGSRPRPPQTVSAVLAPLPDNLDPAELAAIRQRLANGEAVFAGIRSPRRNPLNQRLIGSQGPPKALVRIASVEDARIVGSIVIKVDSVRVGDVLVDFRWYNPHAGSPVLGPFYTSVGALVSELGPSPVAPLLRARP
jgi:hypothetical protein